MNEYLINVKLGEITSAIKEISNEVDLLKKAIKPEQELWDSTDIIRNWKVSERTLASWRAKKMIGYVQVGKKTYYPREARELFLKQNLSEGGNYAR
jgi:hypothetical protein